MWTVKLVVACALLLALLACVSPGPRIRYPVTTKKPVVDDYHGTRIEDPYRWLEDDHSPETKAWVEAQNRVTFDYLARLPEREPLRERLTELWNFERFSPPVRRGNHYFFSKNDGLQNQSVLYVADSLESAPRPLLDPNEWSSDGTVALTGATATEDGRLLAYGRSVAGSDWQEWYVRDVESGRDLPDRIRWVKFSSASWLKDGSGFFYSRFDEPDEKTRLTGVNYYHKLYFHRLGTPQGEDRLIYHRPDQKEWGFYGEVTDDGSYLVITVTRGTDPKNCIFYLHLRQPDSPVVELLPDFQADFTFLDNDGPVFWFRTDLDAPRGRIVAIDIRQPDRRHWRELVPQSEDTLRQVRVVGNRFVAEYLHHASSRLRLFTLDGRPDGEIELPGFGTVSGLSGRRADTELFFHYTSYTVPGRVYRYDLSTRQLSVWRQPKLPFNPDDFETQQVFYTSKDGTRVPMFLSHRKGLKPNGRIPTLLYGYGGFNISLTPSFSVANLVWMEQGGLYAVPNLRGGGEYGETWHQAGMKHNKQNVFDDFIAAAEWLISRGYTSPRHLAIAGGSNGGLLVGACMTQRPDLFAVALPAVGVMDMLRFHKFTIGWAWTAEYGSADNPEDFPHLLAYSPLHNLRPGVRYPATLITTADHDDRVVPAHSFKFAARLQECQARNGPPVLIRIETRAGHGAGKPTAKQIEEATDRLAFALHHTRP
ncbi:prolyl oligopeptidase family serine peptidase [Limisphaera sp. 4302-co]|uniref:prolyl oligopeptidase family serine peptidase n=1 Tax=Limisphaera sp. 4302-co TaxID=3400417 RepID=UPI003C1385B2